MGCACQMRRQFAVGNEPVKNVLACPLAAAGEVHRVHR